MVVCERGSGLCPGPRTVPGFWSGTRFQYHGCSCIGPHGWIAFPCCIEWLDLLDPHALAYQRECGYAGTGCSGLATTFHQGQGLLAQHFPRTALRDGGWCACKHCSRLTDLVIVPFSAAVSRAWPGIWFYVVDCSHLWPGSTDPLARFTLARKPGKCALARPYHRLYQPDHFSGGCALADRHVACVNHPGTHQGCHYIFRHHGSEM